MRFLLFSISLLLLNCSCGQKVQEPMMTSKDKKVKNVILMIGDGMGLSQISSLYAIAGKETSAFERFSYVGLCKTSSAKEKVTDSAAGATSYASGVKTYNGAIGLDTNKQSVPTILELAESKGVATGIVATSSITHATPASFYAHVPIRKMEDSIATFLPTSGVDFFAGGGQKFFKNRKDNLDLYTALAENGYVISESITAKETYKKDDKYGYLVSKGGLPSKLKGRGDFLPLATQQSINYLSSHDQGFFLMIEGSQIDWEGHGRNAEGIVQEVIDFDKALQIALDFAEEDGQTIVVVTADHETGGFALAPAYTGTRWNYEKVQGRFYDGADKVPSAGHTATMVPLFSYGPFAEKFAGLYENTEVFFKLRELTGW